MPGPILQANNVGHRCRFPRKRLREILPRYDHRRRQKQLAKVEAFPDTGKGACERNPCLNGYRAYGGSWPDSNPRYHPNFL